MIALTLLGPPGSGKTTQAKRIAEFLDISWISPGHIFRDFEKIDNDIYTEIKMYTNKGLSVPADLTYQVFEKWPLFEREKRGFIFDSHPRNVDDYTYFNIFLKENDIDLKAVICLTVAEDELLRRLNRRAYIEGRDDETLEVIQQRITVYMEQTIPLLDILSKDVSVYDINGELESDLVWEEIKSVLSPLSELL